MSRARSPRDRGQLSLSAIEAGVGVLLVFSVAIAFGLGLPDTGAREAQLDAYAHDALTILADEPPRHHGTSRLAEVSASPGSFARERAALEHRIVRILPDNLFFRLATPHGAVGVPRPANVPVGQAAVATIAGDVTLWVWYA